MRLETPPGGLNEKPERQLLSIPQSGSWGKNNAVQQSRAPDLFYICHIVLMLQIF